MHTPLQYDYRLMDWSKKCASWCWENHKDSYISYTIDINITIFTFKIFLMSEGKQLLWHVVYFVRWAYIYTFRSLSLIRILIVCVCVIHSLFNDTWSAEQLFGNTWRWLCSMNLKGIWKGLSSVSINNHKLGWWL